MNSELRVLGRRTSSNVQKVLCLLDELGLAHRQEDYGGPFGKTHEAEYLALNPNGTVPTLVDGDVVVWESNAILRYLARREQSPLYPADPVARALTDQWMDWQLGTLSPAFRPVYLALVRERRELAALGDVAADARRLMRILGTRLAASACVAGGELSLADIALGPIVHRWVTLGLAGADDAPLRRYHDRLLARPAFARQVAAVPLA